MKTSYSLVLLVAAFFVGQQSPDSRQDPVKPQDPKPSKAQKEDAQKDDAKQLVGKAKPHKLEGVYRLRERVVNGVTHRRDDRGYLAITGKHMFLSLATPGRDADHPLVHSSVREWTEVPEGFRTVMKLDYHSDGNGKIHFQPFDRVEGRRIRPVRGGVRVIQSEDDWLIFERVE